MKNIPPPSDEICKPYGSVNMFQHSNTALSLMVKFRENTSKVLKHMATGHLFSSLYITIIKWHQTPNKLNS